MAEEVVGQERSSSWLSTYFIFKMPDRHREEGSTTHMAFIAQAYCNLRGNNLTYSLISNLKRNLISHFHIT